MAYNRTPNNIFPGRGLSQTPSQTGATPSGAVSITVEADIAKYTSLGVVQIGSGINVDANGVISVNSTSPGYVNVTLTAVNYYALLTDYYIGCTNDEDKKITITLPLGVVGKIYIIKNQGDGGQVKITGSLGEKIDGFTTLNLSNESGIMVVFDGIRWNVI